MVKLRLTRFGRHKRAFYRLVATDSRNKVNGGYIELLGHYDPLTGEIKLFEDLINKWLANGAQPSETVKSILKDKGIWKKYAATKVTKKPAKAKKPTAVKKPTTVKKPKVAGTPKE